MDTRSLLEVLQRVPQKPAPLAHPRNWTVALRSVAEYVALAPGWLARTVSRVASYPRPFAKIRFPSLDGTELYGWLGAHRSPSRRGRSKPAEPREGILIVPGMFTSKDNRIHRARAFKFYKDWGYHVLAMDLRGFGESARTFNTGGWKEAEDVRAAVEEFRRRVPVTKMHIYAESLGASAALIAAGVAGRRGEKLIDGGLLAVSPFSGARREAEYISTRPVITSDFYMVQWFFLKLLRLGSRREYKDFQEYLVDAAEHYGVPVDELYDRSSPKFFVQDINVPTILLHSDDDPVVPSDHAQEFERLLRGRRNPSVWRLPWGSHCLYELQEPDWFWTVLREFFDFYCILPQPGTGRGRA